jgi:hypothetical protein
MEGYTMLDKSYILRMLEGEKKKKEEELRKALEKSNFTEDMYKVPTPKLLYDKNNYYKFDGGLEPYNPKPATVPGSGVKLDVPKKKESTTQKVLNTSATIKSGVNTGVSSNWEKDDKYKDRKNDSIFRSVNNTKEPTKASKAFMDNDFWVNDSSKELQFMTFSSFMLPEEKKKYNSLYDQKGRTAATEYAYSLIPTFRERRRKQKEFEATEYAARLKKTGVITSYICPLMYMNNPLCGKMPVITSSNKLRTYTTARYYTDDEILLQITKGGK